MEASKYAPESERRPGELATTAPVYRGVEARSGFHPPGKNPEATPTMAGPKLPVESANR